MSMVIDDLVTRPSTLWEFVCRNGWPELRCLFGRRQRCPMCATHTTIARSSLVHLGQAHASEVSKFCVASLSRAHRDETKLVAAFESLPPSSLKWKQTPDGDGWMDGRMDGWREGEGMPPSRRPTAIFVACTHLSRSLRCQLATPTPTTETTKMHLGEICGQIRVQRATALILLSSPFLQSAGCAALRCVVRRGEKRARTVMD